MGNGKYYQDFNIKTSVWGLTSRKYWVTQRCLKHIIDSKYFLIFVLHSHKFQHVSLPHHPSSHIHRHNIVSFISHTNTVPRTSTEGYIGIWMSTFCDFWQEIVWIEIFWFRELCRITVCMEKVQCYLCTSWDYVITYNKLHTEFVH